MSIYFKAQNPASFSFQRYLVYSHEHRGLGGSITQEWKSFVDGIKYDGVNSRPIIPTKR